MAKLDQYQEAVQTALSDYAQMRFGLSSNPELELQTIFDIQHDHYQLVYVGWLKISVSIVQFSTLISKTKKFGFNSTLPKMILPKI